MRFGDSSAELRSGLIKLASGSVFALVGMIGCVAFLMNDTTLALGRLAGLSFGAVLMGLSAAALGWLDLRAARTIELERELRRKRTG